MLYETAITKGQTLQCACQAAQIQTEIFLKSFINDLDSLARHLQLPKQQKIHYFIFGLKLKLKQALLIQHPQIYDDAVTFANESTTLQIPILIST